jgi:hypothetical protein
MLPLYGMEYVGSLDVIGKLSGWMQLDAKPASSISSLEPLSQLSSMHWLTACTSL